MYHRPIFTELEKHLTEPEVSVITGMRRTGKTTALKYLLQKTAHGNKLYLDLERLEYRRIFTRNSFSEMQADLEFLGYDFSQKGVIAIDEVQLIPEVVSFWYRVRVPITLKIELPKAWRAESGFLRFSHSIFWSF